MLPEPLHPAVVHFPIVLVAILPLAAIAALILIRRGESLKKAWTPVLVLALTLAGSAWVAVRTGEAEEEAVEEVVAESAIHEHEEAAELFLPLSAGMVLLVAGGLLKAGPGKAARGVATVAAILLLVAGYRVGHTGGELVYEHGAADAYVVQSEIPAELRYQDRDDPESHDSDRRTRGRSQDDEY